jgi:hypothetical protein
MPFLRRYPSQVYQWCDKNVRMRSTTPRGSEPTKSPADRGDREKTSASGKAYRIMIPSPPKAGHHGMASETLRFERNSAAAGSERWTRMMRGPLAALMLESSALAAQALTPLRDPRDTALLKEAKAACAAPNFPRFLRAFAGSQIVRNAYTADTVRFAETRIAADGRARTTVRSIMRLGFNGFPLRVADGRYVLAPGEAEGLPFGWREEAKVRFESPRQVLGRTVVRWGTDRSNLSASGHESAKLHGRTGELTFVGGRSCWLLTEVRAIHRP